MEESSLSLPGFQPRLLGIQETKGMILRFKNPPAFLHLVDGDVHRV